MRVRDHVLDFDAAGDGHTERQTHTHTHTMSGSRVELSEELVT